ncbi:inositol monophosphatase [Sphingosinicella sp. CPCC 101087]|uniref:inositol monophosphatase family protein n=1 Tax=Sphingosinicella sp. CPCC 101087 TaxID=2497754 RepID=UPI001FB19915|nr:inositol monophosphatase [Sphingosinicella sp. CPCC 101087]
MERTAVELARLAGAEIQTTLGKVLAVEYKGETAEGALLRDPVSEVDHNVEMLIRGRLADRFPGHDILGEESEERPGRDSDFVWAIDPIDGTANFVNGFPLFAASIGVLHRHRPVAGAIWCSASHALRAGVYHARAGGRLHFEGERIDHIGNPTVRRWLAGEPELTSGQGLPWDVRKTGSAAIECAFVAAGLLRVARFARPNVWDVAGGLPLVRATGGTVLTQVDGAWEEFDRFEAVVDGTGKLGDLRHWCRPLIIGDAEAAKLMARSA